MKIKSANRSKWVFESTALYDNQDSTIVWANLIPLSMGTKHQRNYLMKSMKGFFVASSISMVTGAQYDQSTLQVRYRYIVTLVRWMVAKNLWRLSALTTSDFVDFMQGRRGKFHTHRPAESSIENWLTVAELMWLHRQQYVGSIRFYPTILRGEIYARCRPTTPRPFKAIPEEAALPLIQDALVWIERYGPYVTSLTAQFWEAKYAQVGLSRKEKYTRSKEFFDSLESDKNFISIKNMLAPDMVKGYDILTKAVMHTQGATIVVLLFVLGLRNRELVRLDSNCISVEHELSGDAYYIHGIAAKKGGQARKWAIFEPIVQIVRNIIEQSALLRKYSGSKALFLHGSRPLSSPRLKGKRIEPLSVAKRMRLFAIAPYRSERPIISRLHPHAARKTFSRFAVKRDKNALEPMAWQYGHAYAQFTDGVYVGSDIELVEMMHEDDRAELARSLESLLRSERIGGKAGVALEKARDEFCQHLRFKGKAALRTLVKRLIAEKVQIAPCDWGFCVYSMPLSACEGSETGPNIAKRSPEICAGCTNFVVSEKNAFWWNSRIVRDERYLNESNLPEQSVALVSRRLSISRRVLASIQTSQHVKEEK
ncbi:integrase [Massilia sp. MP_M2]|uniref:tyrosine-type recombinase/integrase n=1 Tax=Massilia sp. MP_M2 TaxID=3071713 RepID=UPI00319DC05A